MTTSKAVFKSKQKLTADQIEISPSKMISAVDYFMNDEVDWAEDRQTVKIHIPGETVFIFQRKVSLLVRILLGLGQFVIASLL
jgi:hypothetical protein